MPLGASYRKLVAASAISNAGDGVAQIAYPWLASAVTRNPLLIALVAVAQRLPWLFFSLPAGVITDRRDRRQLMVAMNAARAVLTLVVAATVVARSGGLPGPGEIADRPELVADDALLYVLVLAATVLLGMAEVLYDNSSQTFLPSLIAPADLERANGRLWSVELAANSFLGPPLGAALLAVGFALPFLVDAGTFAVSAALIALIPATTRCAPASAGGAASSWRTELVEGVRWLWRHPLLRPLAITLGVLNALGMATFSLLVLFAQEVLDTTATEFAILGTSAAVGGIAGGWAAGWLSRSLGPGRSLGLTLVGGGVLTAVTGLVSHWTAVWVLSGAYTVLAMLWNVITVSLRQRIIPDHLLGRVNSVYRFFAWGMMPLGSLAGGALVVAIDAVASRELALRLPWLAAGAGHLLLFAFAARRLTTTAIRRAEADAMAASPPPTPTGTGPIPP